MTSSRRPASRLFHLEQVSGGDVGVVAFVEPAVHVLASSDVQRSGVCAEHRAARRAMAVARSGP
jgi:hypothetical protein